MNKEAYLNNPIHDMVERLCAAYGMDNPLNEVTCVDCGRKVQAVHCSVIVCLGVGKSTGPHCGCVKGKDTLDEEHSLPVHP